MIKLPSNKNSITLVFLSILPTLVFAQISDTDLAKAAQNPIAAMYSLPFQYNWNQDMGPTEKGMQSLTNVQPVLPFTINDDWNLISRTIIPVINQHGLAPSGAADVDGVGDVTQSFFFSPKNPSANGWIWGVGPIALLPWGSNDLLSNRQTGLGPTAVVLKQSNGWTRGILANHIWSLNQNPPDNKEKVDATFLQPFFSYTTHTHTTFGIDTESTYDWTSNQWSVPINLTVTQLLKINGQPITIQAGPRFWAQSPENGAQDWGFRVAVTLLFPR